MRLIPSCADFHRSATDLLHFGHFIHSGATADPQTIPRTERYNSDVPESALLSIHGKSAAFR